MNRVLIVGAGPGGASLAYLLARRGVEVTLLERQVDFAREFRGEVLLPGGLEAVQQMGLWSELNRVPNIKLEAAELYLNGRRKARAAFSDQQFGELGPRWTSQPDLLEMLVEQSAAYSNFEFRRGARVHDLIEDDGRVTGVELDGGERLAGSLVVGADGRTSVVRRRSGIEVDRDPTPMDIVWCKLPLPEFFARDPHMRAYIGRGHLLIAAPVPDGHMQIAWIIAKGSFGEIGKRGMPECLDEMAAHVSPDLAGHLERHRSGALNPFVLNTVSDRVRHWSRPGLLLIGDAAHTMSPVGAQGLNIALRDAIVAANHIVPTVLDGAGSLDDAALRIESERVPEIERIQRMQALPPRILLRDTWWSRLLLSVLPVVLGLDIGRGRRGAAFRAFAFGVTDVKLEV